MAEVDNFVVGVEEFKFDIQVSFGRTATAAAGSGYVKAPGNPV